MQVSYIMQANAENIIQKKSLLAEVGDGLRNFPCFIPTHWKWYEGLTENVHFKKLLIKNDKTQS